MSCEHPGFTTQPTCISDFEYRLVFVHDPTDSGDYVIPIGKQTLRPSHIFYTPCSGIWQTVWLEAAPSNHITQLDLDANMDGQGKCLVSVCGNPCFILTACSKYHCTQLRQGDIRPGRGHCPQRWQDCCNPQRPHQRAIPIHCIFA